MKVAWLALLAVGTALASPTADLQTRTPPQAGSAEARELYALVVKGMQSWGLAGAVHATSGHPGGPSANLPGGLPELNRPHPPKQDGVPGTPGNPLGPHKKQGRIYPRRKSCTATKRKRAGAQCPAGATATGRASRYPKLRLNGQGGVMVAFATLSPHAHDILAAVKGWDNPIGTAVAWFDGAMTDLQEAIGGKRVPEIDGNELKLWLVCLFRGTNPTNPDAVDRACQRRRDAPLEERKQQQAIDGLNQVAELCERFEEETPPPADDKLKAEVTALCGKFADTLESMADANAALLLLGEWARARTLNNQDLDRADEAAVAGFIQQGAFGPSAAATKEEAGELASLYLAHMSTYAVVEVEDDGSEVLVDHSRPPAWLELLQMGAGFVPEDRAAVDEALRLLEGTPHLRHLDKEGREEPMARVQTCWDHAGLLLFQPRRWDLVAAAVTYLEGKIRDTGSDLACAPCLAPEGFWVLRCGSAVP